MSRHLPTIIGVSCTLLVAAFGCPDGAFQDPDDSDYCFTVHPETQPWAAASTVCNTEGGNLVSVHDSRTNRFLKKLGDKWIDDSFMWIGANNYAVEDDGGGSTWTWQDGTPFDYTKWGRGEPSAKNQGNGCALFILANERWYNDDCNLASPFICRVSASWVLSTPYPSSSSSPSQSSSTIAWLTTPYPSGSSSSSPSSSSSSSSSTTEWLTTPYPSSSSSSSSSPTTSTPEGSF